MIDRWGDHTMIPEDSWPHQLKEDIAATAVGAEALPRDDGRSWEAMSHQP